MDKNRTNGRIVRDIISTRTETGQGNHVGKEKLRLTETHC